MRVLQITEQKFRMKQAKSIIFGIYFEILFSLSILLGFLLLLPPITLLIVGVWLTYFCVSHEYGISCILDKSSGSAILEKFSVLKQVRVEEIPLISIRKIQVLTEPDLSPSNDPGGYKVIINFSSGKIFELSYTLNKLEANTLITSLEDFLGYSIYRNF